MDDSRLLRIYAAVYGPEAGPWNLSPRRIYIDYQTRRHLLELLETAFDGRSGLRVCNVGIGQGDWDLFLSYALSGRGSLTSVDLQTDICEMLSARLVAERHPNAIRILNEDILRTSLAPGSFDLVTAVGSTAAEGGDPWNFLDACLARLVPGGVLFLTAIADQVPRDDLDRYLSRLSVNLDIDALFEDHEIPFYVLAARVGTPRHRL
jgi:SAM-dependent methyltransferase